MKDWIWKCQKGGDIITILKAEIARLEEIVKAKDIAVERYKRQFFAAQGRVARTPTPPPEGKPESDNEARAKKIMEAINRVISYTGINNNPNSRLKGMMDELAALTTPTPPQGGV